MHTFIYKTIFSNKRLAACNPHHADIPDIEGPIQWLQNIVIAVLKVIAIIPDWCLHWILKELTPAGRTMLRYSGGLRNTFFIAVKCDDHYWPSYWWGLKHIETSSHQPGITGISSFRISTLQFLRPGGETYSIPLQNHSKHWVTISNKDQNMPQKHRKLRRWSSESSK